jgi:hypothetical protein
MARTIISLGSIPRALASAAKIAQVGTSNTSAACSRSNFRHSKVSRVTTARRSRRFLVGVNEWSCMHDATSLSPPESNAAIAA